MLKILNANQIRHVDQFTIKKEPIASIDLMERASECFVDWFLDQFPHGVSVHVFCGIGNNGGDGLAIARMLLLRKYNVKIFVIGDIERGSKEFKINFKRLREIGDILPVKNNDELTAIDENAIIIDAILGAGLSRKVEGLFADVINFINYQNALTISVDISSGLLPDESTEGYSIIKPDYTIAFQVPKLVFMFPESADYVGEWKIINIGLNKQYIDGLESNFHLLESIDFADVFKARHKFTHKGDTGKVLLIAGSGTKTGAAILAAKAILRSGAGLLTVHIPQECQIAMQVALPEAMINLDAHNEYFSFPPISKHYNCIGVGPGLGNNIVTAKAFDQLLKQIGNTPLVIDADAINILSSHKALLEMLPEDSILTPHPKEFQRLVGDWSDDFEKMQLQINFSRKYSVNLVVKGAHSCITNKKGEVFFNNSGNPGMATAGSGDVLTGIICGILAQGFEPEVALKIAVFMHGVAGDYAKEENGEISMIASDIVNNLTNAFNHFSTQN